MRKIYLEYRRRRALNIYDLFTFTYDLLTQYSLYCGWNLSLLTVTNITTILTLSITFSDYDAFIRLLQSQIVYLNYVLSIIRLRNKFRVAFKPGFAMIFHDIEWQWLQKKSFRVNLACVQVWLWHLVKGFGNKFG